MDEEVDILVCGSGLEGLAAVLESCLPLRLEPTSLLVLETPGMKKETIFAAAGTRHQEAVGIVDTPELMMCDMLSRGQILNHRNLVSKVAAESQNGTAWLEDVVGAEFSLAPNRHLLDGHSVPRVLHSSTDLVEAMALKVRELSTVECRRAAIADLVVADDTIDGAGRVLGVVLDNGSVIRCRAVVLAPGGFGNDVGFRSVHHPSLDARFLSTHHGTAATLRCALAIGAMPLHLDRIHLDPWTSPDEDGLGACPDYFGSSNNGSSLYNGEPEAAQERNRRRRGIILVDPATGQRFMNELNSDKDRIDATIRCGHPVLGIFDAKSAGNSQRPACLRNFDSLTLLAGHFGLPALQGTIDEYNAGIVPGSAQFPISEPPFYCVRLQPKVDHCCGGVQVDDRARVISLDGAPIPGLYAAGEFVGGVHGAAPLPGCTNTDAIVFGRIAGRNAADEVHESHLRDLPK